MLIFVLKCFPFVRRVARVIPAGVTRPRLRRPSIGRRLVGAAAASGAIGASMPAAGGKVCIMVPEWGGDGALLAGLPPGYAAPASVALLPDGQGYSGMVDSQDYGPLLGGAGRDFAGALTGVGGSWLLPAPGVSSLPVSYLPIVVAEARPPIRGPETPVPEPAALTMFVVGVVLTMLAKLLRPA